MYDLEYELDLYNTLSRFKMYPMKGESMTEQKGDPNTIPTRVRKPMVLLFLCGILGNNFYFNAMDYLHRDNYVLFTLAFWSFLLLFAGCLLSGVVFLRAVFREAKENPGSIPVLKNISIMLFAGLVVITVIMMVFSLQISS